MFSLLADLGFLIEQLPNLNYVDISAIKLSKDGGADLRDVLSTTQLGSRVKFTLVVGGLWLLIDI